MKSTFRQRFDGLHVAIIMDGNGRWAIGRGRSRSEGHLEGQRAVRSVVRAAPDLDIRTLTLFAFSADNWKRPEEEVSALMQILTTYLTRETEECCRAGVRINVIGRRDRLAPSLLQAIRDAEFRTTFCRRLHLRIAVDYSGRDSILLTGRYSSQEEFLRQLNRTVHSDPAAPAVDLLIRSGGEQRLSDFLLWESAYAELYFSPILWPDFRAVHLETAVREFALRNRRFGASESAPLNPSINEREVS